MKVLQKNSKLVGVDVGGTFTDVFVLDQESGGVSISKVASTKGDQSVGFIEGIEKGAKVFDEINTVVHGTTVGTNALLERKGAKTGIITTKGFRDVLEMRRRDRPTTWGLWGMFEPIVSRDMRLEVNERTLADGTINIPVDTAEVKAAAINLLELGCEAVCVFFINGFANLKNESIAAQIVRDIWPNPYVTAATEILPEIREFERCSTGTLNSYLQPIVANYLDKLKLGLSNKGTSSDVLIVQSNGGLVDVKLAAQFPVRTALSGPAAGVKAAQYIGSEAGFLNVITCDMGGTSFDVSLINKGQITLAAQTEIAFGMVVRTPMVEISTIGAGGGSIANIDHGGLLTVGPESAGSDPGPVSYGLGNDRPTVTDANLLLGRINPKRPIGAKLKELDISAARKAVDLNIAKPLGLSVPEAADAIVRVANAKMAGAIRLVSVERGHDPKDFAIMPFGGGGSLHSGALMKEIGLGASLIPLYPGVTSALGCVVADMRVDTVQTVNTLLDDLNINQLIEKMDQQALKFENILNESKNSLDGLSRVFELDMLYVGQTHSICVPLSVNLQTLSKETIKKAFDKIYLETYGRLLPGINVRVINLRIAVIGNRPKLDLSSMASISSKSVEECQIETRLIWCDGAQVSAKVYERLDLPIGGKIVGPALLEQPDTTIFIEPNMYGEVDHIGNLLIRWCEE